MALLAELNVTKIGTWKDRAGEVVWKDTDDVAWKGSNVLFLSLEGFLGDHYWDEYIATFTPPQYSMAKGYGGHCKMSFGSLSVSPDTFEATLWPPPVSFNVSFFYTATTEGAKETLFSGVAYLAAIGREEITYDLYGEDLDADLLLEETNYDGDTVILPRAFGVIQHQQPVRLADVGGEPTYHNAYIGGSLAIEIASAADNGSGKVRFTTSINHGFTNGDTVTVEVDDFGSTYNTTQIIAVIDVTNFDFESIAYVDNQGGHAFKSGYWRVHDDGLPISGNATDHGDNTFSLDTSPVGEVTISGTGAAGTTLSTILTWACDQARLNQNYDASLARAPSPDINYWASSQRVLIEFCSDLCSVHTHLTYINTNTQTLFLVALESDNGSRTLTEFDFFAAQYSYEPPVAQIMVEWIMREAVEETIGKYIKNVDYDTFQKSNYPYGEEWDLNPFHNVKADIDTMLSNIITNIHKPRMQVPMPLLGSIPVPGEKITLTDTSLRHSTTVVFHCRNIRYDFQNDEIVVEGEGTIT